MKNYSLLIMEDSNGDEDGGGVDGDGAVFTVMMMDTSGGGMEEPSGGDSGSVSPLRSSPAAAFCLSVFWFCVSPPPPLSKRQGTFFIGVFRSRRSRWTKDRRQKSHEGQNGGSHAATVLGHVGPPLFAFWTPFA